MKKIIYGVIIVALVMVCGFCVGRMAKIEAEYTEKLESLETMYESQTESIVGYLESEYDELNESYMELEEQVYRSMTGETYDITVRHGDETHNWTCKDNKGLFKDVSHIISY